MGTLEKLQKSVFEYLRSLNDLSLADIFAEGAEETARGGKAEGLAIEILHPMPLSASKYAAGPTFSEVEISLTVLRNHAIAARAPSLTTACEILSRALHNWKPPLECGYGRICIAQNAPWKRVDSAQCTSKILLKFNAQSVLS